MLDLQQIAAIAVPCIAFVIWFIRLESCAKKNEAKIVELHDVDQEQWEVVTAIKDYMARIDKNVALVQQSIEHNELTHTSIAIEFKEQTKKTGDCIQRMCLRLEKVEVTLAEHAVKMARGEPD
jgi:hypothetical protein